MTQKSDFNLSEKVTEGKMFEFSHDAILLVEDVKEFIRRLKKRITEQIKFHKTSCIDKKCSIKDEIFYDLDILLGDKLI